MYSKAECSGVAEEELAQHYLLEVTARARTVQGRCGRLLESEFISESPKVLARTIGRVCWYLERASLEIYREIDWSASPQDLERDFRLLRLTDRLVQFTAQQLRYVEGARTERLPWSIVASFEALVATFLPEIRIMLRAMWHYNYAFHMNDQGASYRRYLAELADYVPDVDLERDVLAEFAQPFHIISFPSLEKKHILLHSLLGHEIGHLLVGRYLTSVREAQFIDRVKSEIDGLVDKNLEGFPAEEFKNPIRDQMFARSVQEALTFWRRALEELLADATGVILFGPAALFSTLEMAVQAGYDIAPSEETDHYPPWRLRLRKALEVLENHGTWFPVPTELFPDADRALRVNARVQLIRSIVADDQDLKPIQANPLAKLAYREVMADLTAGVSFLTSDCDLDSRRPNPDELYARLPALIDRLDNFIPPNAFEASLADSRVPGFDEILNTAWFHKVSLNPFDSESRQLKPEAVEIRDVINNLTLKAIEFAHLTEEYKKWTPSRKA